MVLHSKKVRIQNIFLKPSLHFSSHFYHQPFEIHCIIETTLNPFEIHCIIETNLNPFEIHCIIETTLNPFEIHCIIDTTLNPFEIHCIIDTTLTQNISQNTQKSAKYWNIFGMTGCLGKLGRLTCRAAQRRAGCARRATTRAPCRWRTASRGRGPAGAATPAPSPSAGNDSLRRCMTIDWTPAQQQNKGSES